MFRIGEMRRRAGLSQRQAADALGIRKDRLGDWERGTNMLSLGDACALADLFGCTLDELAGREWPSVQTVVDPVDRRLLDLYHGTDARGRATIMRVAEGERGVEGRPSRPVSA